jgi:hypothetical protein
LITRRREGSSRKTSADVASEIDDRDVGSLARGDRVGHNGRGRCSQIPTISGSDKLKDMVALITGGDSGIGRSVAVLFVPLTRRFVAISRCLPAPRVCK